MLSIYNFLSPTEIVYLSILLTSFFSGFVLRSLNKQLKEISCGLLGLFLVYISCGYHIIHSLLTTIVSIIILQNVTYKISHCLVFIWCFGYLFVFRSPELFHFAKPNEIANAVQLIITLRLVGVAFEMNKSQQIHQHIVTAKPSEMINLYNFKELTAIDPSGFSIFIYAYCYAGLFTGPYYKFRTFQDTLEWPDHIPKPSDKFLLRRLQDLPLNAFLFVVTSYFVNTKILRSEEFFDDEKYNIFYRLGIFVAIFMLFRLRMYCGWILSECLCMSLQLGAYPIEAKSISGEGPTDLSAFKEWKQERKVTKDATKNKPTEENLLLDSYDFKTIENISIWGCEFMPTIREGMKSWNKTVQYWLAINIYKRCYGPRYFKTLMTMVVSAYWHGLYPGYYLAFLSIVLALWAESSLEVIVSVLGSCLPPNSLSFLRWIMKMRIFEYCTIAFLIKDLETTLRIWSSVHYVMHLICLVIICLAVMLQFLGIYQKPYSDDSKSK